MSAYRYCTPEWFRESAKYYSATPEFEQRLKKVSWKFCFRVRADADWGIDRDIIFGAFFDRGKLDRIGLLSEEEAFREGDFLLAAPPQEWKRILRKQGKFTGDFMLGKIALEHGDIKKVVMAAPYANMMIDAITALEVRFPDEMTAEELATYRTDMQRFMAELGV